MLSANPNPDSFLSDYVKGKILESADQIEKLGQNPNPVLFGIAFNSLCSWHQLHQEIELSQSPYMADAAQVAFKPGTPG